MRIVQIVSRVAITFIIGLVISCNINPAEEEPESIIVNFPDPNFEAVIREKLGIPENNITDQDMWKIKNLNGMNRNISDLTGIEFCSGLNTIFLNNNFITNIEPLSELVLLDYINLHNNQIVDILPLVNNRGLGIGNDVILISNNPLSDESILYYKPLLQLRGVEFYSNTILDNPGEINFMDANFEEVIREHLDKPTGAILNTDLDSLTNINGRNRNIYNIYGIEFCTNLATLDIGENQIKDLIPIFYLREIKKLRLDNNDIDDISSLRYFNSLIDLDLGNNKIADISYISGLSDLKSLHLDNNYIQDISAVSYLLNLRYLSLNGNPIYDFEPLDELDSLAGIELKELDQFDINHINSFTNLQLLFLTNTHILNFDKIADLINLKVLAMNNCGISNIDSLKNLSQVNTLSLNDNAIVNITVFTELFELQVLKLQNNNISDIQPLINNWGISGGKDYVFLNNNPLSETSINTYIPQLENRGVNVYY